MPFLFQTSTIWVSKDSPGPQQSKFDVFRSLGAEGHRGFKMTFRDFTSNNLQYGCLKTPTEHSNQNSMFLGNRDLKVIILLVNKEIKNGRVIHRANLPSQGICLRRQGKSFTLYALLPCTNPRCGTEISVSPRKWPFKNY